LLFSREYCIEDFDDDEIMSLAISLALHDIGRDNDIEDEQHGAKSFEVFRDYFKRVNKIPKDCYKEDWVKFLMSYHCISDNIALKELNNMNLSTKDIETLKFFYNILKDADALDRVRFGIKELDVDYFRLKNSIKYVLFATQSQNQLEL